MTRQSGGLIGGLLAFIVVLLPTPEGMSPMAQRAAAVTVLMAVWWMTEAIPIAATAFVPAALFPLLGILDAKATAANYGHNYVLMFLAGFFIDRAFEVHQLHRRIALSLIHRINTSRRRIVLSFMLATSLLSMWIANVAVTLLMLPIGMAVASRDDGKGGSFNATIRVTDGGPWCGAAANATTAGEADEAAPFVRVLHAATSQAAQTLLVPLNGSTTPPPEPTGDHVPAVLGGNMMGYAWFINGIAYVYPSPALIYLSHDLNKYAPLIPAEGKPVAVKVGAVVDVYIPNLTKMWHPLHLHGNQFWVMAVGPSGTCGSFANGKPPSQCATNYTQAAVSVVPGARLKQDSIGVPPLGWVLVRFAADNPGVWLFHCHIDFHLARGMAIVFLVGDGSEQPALPLDFPGPGNAAVRPRCGRA